MCPSIPALHGRRLVCSSSSRFSYSAQPDQRPSASGPETDKHDSAGIGSRASQKDAPKTAEEIHLTLLKSMGWPKIQMTPRMIGWIKNRARQLATGEKVSIRADFNQGALHRTEGWQPKVHPADGMVEEDSESDTGTLKRKCAVLVGYAGTGYRGSQVNGGVETIEGDVFAALVGAGAVSRSNAVNPNKVNMRRAARTDAGVHAATNVLSIKLELPPSVRLADELEESYLLTQAARERPHALEKSPRKGKTTKDTPPIPTTWEKVQEAKFVADKDMEDLRQRVNQFLPANVRVVGLVRAPRGFQARTFASSRQYEYIMPTFVFQPPRPGTAMYRRYEHYKEEEPKHATPETTGTQWMSEAKMPAWMAELFVLEPPLPSWDYVLNHPTWEGIGPRPPKPTTPPIPEDYRASHQITVRQEKRAEQAQRDGEILEKNPEQREKEEALIQRHWYRHWDETREKRPDEQAYYADVYRRMKQFRLPDWQLERARRNLQMMIRKHNFHNFTVRRRFKDPSMWRYMKELTLSEPFMGEDGIEYVSFRFHGVSFMLHQIRKMVAAVVLTTRSRTPTKIWYHLFQSNRILVPIAPAEGLFLESPIFGHFHDTLEKRKEDLIFPLYPRIEPHDPLEVDTFKRERIYPQIFSAERDHRAFSKWVKFLDEHSSPLFGYLNPWGEVPEWSILPELTGKAAWRMSSHPQTVRRLLGKGVAAVQDETIKQNHGNEPKPEEESFENAELTDQMNQEVEEAESRQTAA